MKLLPHPFDDAQCARLPAEGLGLLAALRCEPGVEAALCGDHAYIRWRAGDDQVIRAIFPHPSCVFFMRRGDQWHRRGCALPEFDFPSNLDYRPLYRVLLPAPVVVLPVAVAGVTPCPVRLAADQVPRPTRGLRCAVADFMVWAEHVPECVLETMQGVIDGPEILVLGNRLPWIPAKAGRTQGERYSGQRVLVPIGFRPEPMLAEAELRAAAEVADEDLLILDHRSWQVVDTEQFAPLGHAALAVACGATAPSLRKGVS